MIRTGAQYRQGLGDGRQVWIDGQRATDVCVHPADMRIVDIRARTCDIQHELDRSSVPTNFADNDGYRPFNRPPMEQQDWHDKGNAVDAVLQVIKGVVRRVGDETAGKLWSWHDGRDVLSEIDPRLAANITRYIDHVIASVRQRQAIAMTRCPTMGIIL
jgi:4-hydroxyphenylacetate 3-monooxygenase